MITKIFAENMKGWTGEQTLTGKDIFSGKNGSGKSTISQALCIALNGFVFTNGETYKKPGDIFKAFGTEGQKLVVGFEIDNKTMFRRIFSKGKSGSVSQRYKVHSATCNKAHFERMLGENGSPKIFDLVAFQSLSDQKKIDTIFELFPPGADIEALTTSIEDFTEKINKKNADIKTKNSTISDITASLSKIVMPAGTLAETQGNIKNKEEAIRKAEIELSSFEASERVRIQNEKQLYISRCRQLKEISALDRMNDDDIKTLTDIEFNKIYDEFKAEFDIRTLTDIEFNKIYDEFKAEFDEDVKVKIEAELRKKIEDEKSEPVKDVSGPEWIQGPDVEHQDFSDACDIDKSTHSNMVLVENDKESVTVKCVDVHSILKEIIQQIDGAGCKMCAVKMFVLKKIKEM